MKALYFVLASFQLSLAAPAVPAEPDAECACPMPLCPPSQPERCECQNAEISACWDRQLSEGKVCPAPALKDCGSISTSLSTSTLPTSPARRELAAAPSASCSCEPVFCAQIWPQSCRCSNTAKVSCYQSCGGVAPALQNCGDTPEQSAALYGAFAQPSQTAPVFPTNPGPVLVSSLPAVESMLSSSSEVSESTLSFERPSTIPSPPSELEPTCQCEPTFCVASWPAGCHCQNRGALDCYDKCGGTYPTLQDCGADPNADTPTRPEVTPAGVPPDTVVTPQAECQQCHPVFCAQSWPLSCLCSNQAASDCAALCGRPTPELLDCNAADPETLDATLPGLFDMIPDPNDIPIIFTNLIADLPDPLELPVYLENLPDYINDLTDDEPWSETHTWYSFFTPAATSLIDPLASNVAPAFTGLPDAPLAFPNEERAAAAPSISGAAAENYHVCGHRAAVPCPTGYNCVRRPGASCGPELDCGGYCVDVLNGVTLLADAAATSTQSDTATPLEFSQITDFYPTNTLVTSRRGNVMLPPRQVAAPESVGTEEAASTATSVFPPIPCGEGYPPCDPGLQCVDIFVSGIGFAEKRSYCAAVSPGDASSPSSLVVAASSPIASLDDNAAPSPTHYPWPDTAWPGPITTLYPMFGPGPVGLSNYHPSSSTTTPAAAADEAAAAASSALPPALAPVPNGAHPAAVPYPPIVPPPVSPGPLSPPAPTATPTTEPPAPMTLQCGGPTNETCPSGFACVRDLDATAESPTGGCGPACGEAGVCIVPQRCGGFAGTPCDEPGRTCVDDPDDGCDPLTGGADCMGICV